MNSFTLFLIAGLALGASAVDYRCSYAKRIIWFADNATLYDCEIIEGRIDRYEDRMVGRVTGIHKSSKSNDDVESLSIKNRNHMHMPHGMDDVFENIISLDVWRVGLRGIHRQDMEQYPNLKFVSFNENNLHKLENDVFKYNPQLEVILLYGNKIATVDGTFKDLNNLRYLDFIDNVCHSGVVKHNRGMVNALIKQINSKCP